MVYFGKGTRLGQEEVRGDICIQYREYGSPSNVYL